MTITEIQEKLKKNEFEITFHAFEEAIDDFLSLSEVVSTVRINGKIIEEYPEDFRCLIHCKSKRQHIHVVVDYHDCVKLLCPEIEIITIYKPDPQKWINYRKRRK